MKHSYVDMRFDAYSEFLPRDWCESTLDIAPQNSLLRQRILDLFFEWRGADSNARIPAAYVSSLRSFAESFIREYGQKFEHLDIALQIFASRLPPFVQTPLLLTTLANEFCQTAKQVRLINQQQCPTYSDEDLWNELVGIKDDELIESNDANTFRIALASSQRVSFVAFYNAYEHFLLNCVLDANHLASGRSGGKEFKKNLTKAFGDELKTTCWTDPELNIFRLVRHSLTHAGGRITKDLNGVGFDKNPRKFHLVDGQVHIIADDNGRLMTVLRNCVLQLVEKAATADGCTKPASND